MTNIETGQTDLRIKSAKLNFYTKHGASKNMKSHKRHMMHDDKSGLWTGVRTSGNIVVDHLLRTEEYEPKDDMSILKTDETNILENIAINFEILNNSLAKSMTPSASNQNAQ